MSKDYKKVTRETYNSISENWDTKREYCWKPVKEFVLGFENRGDLKLLDLGCGGGRHLEFAQKSGFSVSNLLGCDFSSGQLDVVSKKGFGTCLCDLEKLDFADLEFDVIVCIAAFHHLLDKKGQLRSLLEMRRILKNDGRVLISNWFPSDEFLKKQVDKGKFEFLDADRKKVRVTYTDLTQARKKFDRFYYLFDEDELLRLCCDAGFSVLKKECDRGNLYLTLEKKFEVD